LILEFATNKIMSIWNPYASINGLQGLKFKSNALKLYYKQSSRATFTSKREHKKILLVEKIMNRSNLIGSHVLVFPLAEWVRENYINPLTHQFMVLCKLNVQQKYSSQ
jgi:hypothetical protein